ncbi:MAG: D-glycero-beta-D-manno-heptose 1,7-bisphosphate 7-phosphatase [Anaerolineae bacterium]|nr:D-glycero-beta-D-manno-heptose 1,7-bisphosphate 7-phosphatase [Anaerolineae bacterium]
MSQKDAAGGGLEAAVRAVFLDRDGVINENREDYVKSWDEFSFLPGALEALRRLAASPLLIVVVTNQAAIGRGLVSADMVHEVNRRMIEEIEATGGRVDALYLCPHNRDESCECRKPKPGLLIQAAQEMGIDLGQSYCVGDKLSDLEAGRAVGCGGVLVLTGVGRDQDLANAAGYRVVSDLAEAVETILAGLDRE